MAEPEIRREGNLRVVGVRHAGWPVDVGPIIAPIDALLAEQAGVEPYGPVQVLVDLPPDDPDPTGWACQVSRAATGLPTAHAPMAVEDYAGLVAVVLAHQGPAIDLVRTWRRCVDHARSLDLRPRPYWRVALVRRSTPDGQAIPLTEVAVFVDR